MQNTYSPPCTKIKISSPVGSLFIAASENGLTHLTLQESRIGEIKKLDDSALIKAQKILEIATRQLEEYFAGMRNSFDVPLLPQGTDFQKRVWSALINTKHGQTLSYSDIADKINRPKAVRAVGAANGANHIAIIIPCHRVIGKSGNLTGYAYGLEMKQFLLDLES